MILLKTLEELRQWRAAQSATVGFVPTMGHLHAGHLSLLQAARDDHPVTVASIFLNPLQFASMGDLESYPVTMDADRQELETLKIDALFQPTEADIYPDSFGTVVRPIVATSRWEDEFRPGHFDGVCTVVAKLFNLVQPDEAYFGEKDFQQLKVISAMVEDLNIPVSIKPCPTIRDADGLALSSRNDLIEAELRPRANTIYVQLKNSAKALLKGASVIETERAAVAALTEAGFVVDYFALVDSTSLEPLKTYLPGGRLLAAAQLGDIRLIDNYPV